MEPGEREVVGAGGVRLAVHDHGGDGPAVVAMHGGRSTLRDWDVVARRLDRRVRLVVLDLRGHGRSEASDDFTPRALVSDVEAVIEALALDDPVVIGHSMGGMIAAHFGQRHPGCRMVMNIDGHHGRLPSQSQADWDELAQQRREQLVAIEHPRESGDDAWFEHQLQMWASEAAQAGANWAHIEPGVRRSFERDDEGVWRRRPSVDWMMRVYEAEVDGWTMFDTYQAVRCPFTFVKCTVTSDGASGRQEMLRSDLADLAAARENMRLVEADTDHMGVMFRGAALIAELVLEAAGAPA